MLMGKRLKIVLTMLALTGCGFKSTVVDDAVMYANYRCASYVEQQSALRALRIALGSDEAINLRCDTADCSAAFAIGPAFGGKVTLQASPGYVSAGWFNDRQPPSVSQKARFKVAAETVVGCKVTDQDGW